MTTPIILSISGVFKTVLMLIGAMVLLRFFGQLMIAKRNIAAEKAINEREKKFNKERDRKLKSFGKTRVVKKSDVNGTTQDVDYEEVN